MILLSGQGWDPTWFSGFICTWELLHRVMAIKLMLYFTEPFKWHKLWLCCNVTSNMTRLFGFLQSIWETTVRVFYVQIWQRLSPGSLWGRVTGIGARPGSGEVEPGVGMHVWPSVVGGGQYDTHCCRHLLPERAQWWAELIHSKKTHWKTCQKGSKKR